MRLFVHPLRASDDKPNESEGEGPKADSGSAFIASAVAFAQGESPQDQGIAERKAEPISFGPLSPGRGDRELMVLVLNKRADPKRITHEVIERLPEPVNLRTSITGTGTNLVAEISIYVAQQARLPKELMIQNKFEAIIRFKSDESGVEISPSDVPINLAFDVNPALWETESPPSADSGASGSKEEAETARREMVKARKEAEISKHGNTLRMLGS